MRRTFPLPAAVVLALLPACTAVEPTPAVTADRPLEAGRPWSAAQAYLDRLDFAGGNEAHRARVRMCPTCSPAVLTLRPERGAYRLTAAALRDSMRIIARIDIDTPAYVPALGMRAGARHRSAWLLTHGRHAAVAMYDSAGRIAFGPPWLLEVSPGEPAADGPRARWRPLDRARMRVAPGVFPDLSAAWVACGGGGCTALPLR